MPLDDAVWPRDWLRRVCFGRLLLGVFGTAPGRMHAGRPGRYSGHGGGAGGAAANGQGCHPQVFLRGLEPTVELERGQKARAVDWFHAWDR